MLKNETLFFELALKSDALLLGDFTLKSGKKVHISLMLDLFLIKASWLSYQIYTPKKSFLAN